MMMEQNARGVRRQAPEPYPEPENHDGTKVVSWKNLEPHSDPELFEEKSANNVPIHVPRSKTALLNCKQFDT